MTRILRLTTVVVLLVQTCGFSRVVLFDRYTNVDQKTEIRYDAPDGRVVTGLGFRANYDNITTMYVRHHRITDSAELVDPCEVHLGSEPDHACEATVMLPKGYIAVGFGAAGEPEWDVTVLHVWARPLQSDGTLGPMKQFSDGFKPERDSERSFTLSEDNRVLTGVGLRFGFNDITGIYASSQRILPLGDGDSKRIEGFSRSKVWLLRAPRSIHPDVLTEQFASFPPNRVDMFIDSDHIGDDRMMVWYRELTAIVKKNAAKSMAWLATTDRGKVEAVLSDPAGFAGIVLDTHLPTRKELAPEKIFHVAELCRIANKSLALRLDPADADVYKSMVDVIDGLEEDVSVIVRFAAISPKTPPLPAADLTSFGSRKVLVEIDLTDTDPQYPDIHIDELPGIVADAALSGADGFLTPVNSRGLYLPRSINALNLHALQILAYNPFVPIDALWTEVCVRRYGTGAEPAIRALKRTAQANRLIFLTLGVPAVRNNGRLLTVPQINRKVRSMLSSGRYIDKQPALNELLDTTDKTVSRAAEEKETAHWLLIQSQKDAQAAMEANPCEATWQLTSSIEDLDRAASYLRIVTDAWLRASVYGIDGSDETRYRALTAAREVRNNELSSTDLGIGAEAFASSVENTVQRSEKTAAVTVALEKVEELAATGKDTEAVEALLDVLNSERLGPHLQKRWQAVSAAASKLSALWSCPDNLGVCWGGDGKWTMEKVADRWCWVIGEGRPCLYLDVPGPQLSEPADYVVHFEYFDKGDWTLHFEYDSDYPDSERRQYHRVEPLQLTNTEQWKEGSFAMPRSLFSSGQNLLADMRFVTGNGACIRNIRLEKQ